METFLRRYTELPYIIEFLHTEQLALLNPASWDDRNDSFYIEEYARRAGVGSVHALCLADGIETYHHWRVFSHGSGGACIQFRREHFLAAVAQAPGLRAQAVQYKTLNELQAEHPATDALPFLKRHAFQDENEFRLFHASAQVGPPIHRIAMPRSAVDRIILSPWLPQSVSQHVKQTLKALPGCSRLKVYRSTLVENENWKKLAHGGG